MPKMELCRDQEIRALEEIARSEAKLTDDDYTFYLKKDEWTEMGAIWLFDPVPEQVGRWYGLIESSRNAGKLKPSRYERRAYPSKENIYYYDPCVIIHWAISKQISLPDKLIQWHDHQLKLTQTAASELESRQTNQPGTDVSVQSEEKTLTETERAIFGKILLGMAMDSYKYDPDSDTNTATGSKAGSIKSALQKYGLDADVKTISKYLREAANQNPTARPRKT